MVDRWKKKTYPTINYKLILMLICLSVQSGCHPLHESTSKFVHNNNVGHFKIPLSPSKGLRNDIQSPLFINHIHRDTQRANLLGAKLGANHLNMDSTIALQGSSFQQQIDYDTSALLWTAIIMFGTPPKPFKIDLDTGSADLTVAGYGCQEIENQYNPSESATAEGLPNYGIVEFEYGTLWSSGFVFRDAIQFGDYNLTQAFGAFLNVSGSYGGSDGIGGLAFPSIAVVKGTDNIVTNLYKHKTISRNIFAFALSQDEPHVEIGGYDPQMAKGDIVWQDYPSDKSKKKDFWYFTIGMQAQNEGTSGALQNFSAIIDTGTANMLLTTDVFNRLFANVPNITYNPSYRAMSLPCNSNATLTISTGADEHVVPLTHYTRGRISNTTCVTSIMNGGDVSILGDAFLKDWYAIFDQESGAVGLAPAAFSDVWV